MGEHLNSYAREQQKNYKSRVGKEKKKRENKPTALLVPTLLFFFFRAYETAPRPTPLPLQIK